jgi:putative DNA primase/helicase
LSDPQAPDDPFARVAQAAAGDASESVRPTAVADPGDHVSPVPAGAPSLPTEWRGLGSPSRAWAFRDASGRVLRYTLRFPEADATKGEAGRPRSEWTGKTIRAATLRRTDNGRLRWALKAEPGARPLYGLDRLAARPGAPVLMTEGEKDADGAAERFPEFVCITWPGGSNAVAKADFGPLHGRDVIVWGDADGPGRKAAQLAARAAVAAGATTVAVVDPPAFFPDGWGLADEWPEGFDQSKAHAMIANARLNARPVGVEWPWGFRMDEGGLWYDQPAQGGGKPIPTWISAPFEVVGRARDSEGNGWAVVVRFRDPDGREKTIPVAMSRLAAGGAEVRSELAGAGLMITPARGKADKFAIALTQVDAKRRLRLVSATGWCGDRFVLPAEVIGDQGGEAVIFTGDSTTLRYGRKGSIEGWRASVAAWADGNGLFAFGLSIAFLGPLLRPLDAEGGGFHFRGSSAMGKSTIGRAAGSVWGGGNSDLGFAQSWRATANAMESVAVAHNDGLLVLDEMGQSSSDEIGPTAYMLASGQAKARSSADGSLRSRSEWRTAFVSNGEISLEDHMRSGRGGSRVMAGMELRFLDISADAGGRNPDGSPMGIWENLHGLPDSLSVALAMRDATAEHYGHAGPAFVAAFVSRRDEALREARALISAFVQEVAREGDTAQAKRAALRFGAVAAAGELATLFGVTGWPAGLAAASTAELYHRWAAGFGRDRSHEASAILRRFKVVIQGNAANFAAWREDHPCDDDLPSAAGRDEQARGMLTWGYRKQQGPIVSYLFNEAGWEAATTGYGRQEAAKALFEAGFLDRGDGSHWPKRHKRDGKLRRYWTVKSEILEADLGD